MAHGQADIGAHACFGFFCRGSYSAGNESCFTVGLVFAGVYKTNSSYSATFFDNTAMGTRTLHLDCLWFPIILNLSYWETGCGTPSRSSASTRLSARMPNTSHPIRFIDSSSIGVVVFCHTSIAIGSQSQSVYHPLVGTGTGIAVHCTHRIAI